MRDDRRIAERRVLKERVLAWAQRIRVSPTQVRVQKMTRKWASCSTLGWISLAEDLIHEPVQFQDFVIVHELLHMRVPNHGKLFKSLMSIYVPNWRKLSSDLEQSTVGRQVGAGRKWTRG